MMTKMKGAKMIATLPTKCSIEPAGIRILVLPDPYDDGNTETGDEIVTGGGIVIPKESEFGKDRERERVGQRFGVLTAVGPLAWQDYDRFASKEGWRKWAHVGDRVSFARYAGDRVVDPETGIEFLVMNDNDINAIIHSEKGNVDG
jgi:co-chaperonin GroES (HSP10)